MISKQAPNFLQETDFLNRYSFQRGQTMNNSKFGQNTAMITIIGAILALVGTVSYIADPTLAHITTGFGLMTRILIAVGFAMVTAGLFGLWQSGGLDQDSGLAKVGFGMSVIGQLLVVLFALVRTDLLGIATASILGIGMIITGLAVLQANQWQSWHKFVPILYGLSPLSAIFLYPVAASFSPNAPDQILSGITLVVWIFFGIALWIEAGQMSAKSTHNLTS